MFHQLGLVVELGVASIVSVIAVVLGIAFGLRPRRWKKAAQRRSIQQFTNTRILYLRRTRYTGITYHSVSKHKELFYTDIQTKCCL